MFRGRRAGQALCLGPGFGGSTTHSRSAMISQFFILSSKGDPLIYKDCILDPCMGTRGAGAESRGHFVCSPSSLAVSFLPASPRGQRRSGRGRALLPEADGSSRGRISGCHGNRAGSGWRLLPPREVKVSRIFFLIDWFSNQFGSIDPPHPWSIMLTVVPCLIAHGVTAPVGQMPLVWSPRAPRKLLAVSRLFS